MFRRLLPNVYSQFSRKDYFQQAFGYHCVDLGRVAGTLGYDVEAAVFLRLRKDNVWPIGENHLSYTEDDAFDVVEFLYDCVSKPIGGSEHTFMGCGWHYNEFDQETGRREFRSDINNVLRDYQDGYELSEDGDVPSTGPGGDAPTAGTRATPI